MLPAYSIQLIIGNNKIDSNYVTCECLSGMVIISFTGCDVLLTDNGLIIYSQQSEDVVIASYFCDDGYILNVTEDRHELTCQANGVWSGFEPSCIG